MQLTKLRVRMGCRLCGYMVSYRAPPMPCLCICLASPYAPHPPGSTCHSPRKLHGLDVEAKGGADSGYVLSI